MNSKLKIQFDPNQFHQIEAISQTVELFDGLPAQDTSFQMIEDTVGNIPHWGNLDRNWLLENLEDLDIRELDLLKDTIDALILHMERVKSHHEKKASTLSH